MKIRLHILGLLTIICCSTKHDTQTIDKKPAEQKTEDQKKNDKESILYKKAILHSFSAPVDMDSFSIYITGQSIKNGEINFQIKTSKGQLILDEKYPSVYFVDYGFDKTLGTEEEYIKKRVDSFFDEKRFKQPAITADEIFDEDYSDKEIWDDIKSDKSSIGFSYFIGDEDGRYIAYSKKMGKVVLYFNCC